MVYPYSPQPVETGTVPVRSFLRRWLWQFVLLDSIVCVAVAFMIYLSLAPGDFTPRTVIRISEGQSIQQIARTLSENHVIESERLFMLAARVWQYDTKIVAGDYLFSEPINLIAVIKRLADGEHQINTVRLTIPEGFTNAQIAETLREGLPLFDTTTFQSLTTDREGYLFPDTYFVFETATTGEVVSLMKENFIKKTAPLKDRVEQSGYSMREVVILASLLEEEVQTVEDKQIVAGIIENRLAKGMPLQLDATFRYILGKSSAELTLDDLDTKSPYNTYRNKGLPPTPISNPGLDSIQAILEPKATAYLYYLSDKNGVTRYAKTFEEHKLNKERYLR